MREIPDFGSFLMIFVHLTDMPKKKSSSQIIYNRVFHGFFHQDIMYVAYMQSTKKIVLGCVIPRSLWWHFRAT